MIDFLNSRIADRKARDMLQGHQKKLEIMLRRFIFRCQLYQKGGHILAAVVFIGGEKDGWVNV